MLYYCFLIDGADKKQSRGLSQSDGIGKKYENVSEDVVI